MNTITNRLTKHFNTTFDETLEIAMIVEDENAGTDWCCITTKQLDKMINEAITIWNAGGAEIYYAKMAADFKAMGY